MPRFVSRSGAAGRMLRSAALAAALSLSGPAFAQQSSKPAQEPDVSPQARSLYEKTRDSVAQIRLLLGTSDTHAATGTGFVVGRGLILTNYHVVADKAMEPDTYRLEFVLPSGHRGALEIVAVDVTNDLAIVKGDTANTPTLGFRDGLLQKGDKGFSLGYPLAQGLTVVEGIYNGRSEEQYYERFHFTGAINPGMSGGPVVDTGGRVFGVNVAIHRQGQLVGFLVPAKLARRLLARAGTAAPRNPDFRADVGKQLNAHQAEIMGALLKEALPVQRLGEFTLPGKSGAFMQCGAGTEREPNRPYTVDSYYCYTYSALYIDQRLHTGWVSYRHSILRASDLGALRFAHLHESRFDTSRFGDNFDRKHHTRYACDDEIVAIEGTRAKMVMCVRRYKRFEGLYDVSMKLATLGDPGIALQSVLEMQGVSFAAATEFTKRYLDAIRWTR
jgi:serine protease Do